MSICELKNITKIYSVGEQIIPVKNISFEINSGDFISIQGDSGTGKSTLLMIIGGLLKPSSGSIIYQGKDITNYKEDNLAEHRGKNIGFLFQNVQLCEALTIEQNIILAKKYSGNNEISQEDIQFVMNELGILDKRNFLPHQLSGGQKRRAMIATTWIRNPSLILADEPTNDLDHHWATKVFSLFCDWVSKGKAIVFVTHNDDWSNYATKKFHLNNGALTKI
ncbi:MAG: hypothetical protein H6Q68_1327 [Firmicutes bacterium]|nr:hypothetical protein [Bacillota bacterium]